MNPDQLSLFEEKQVEAADSEEPSAVAVQKRDPSRHPKPKKSNSCKENLDSLPQENCEYDLDDKTCPDCYQEMKQISHRLASRETVHVPARTNVYAKTYKCQHCHPSGGDKLITASPLFNHSYISSNILVAIVVNKITRIMKLGISPSNEMPHFFVCFSTRTVMVYLQNKSSSQ